MIIPGEFVSDAIAPKIVSPHQDNDKQFFRKKMMNSESFFSDGNS